MAPGESVRATPRPKRRETPPEPETTKKRQRCNDDEKGDAPPEADNAKRASKDARETFVNKSIEGAAARGIFEHHHLHSSQQALQKSIEERGGNYEQFLQEADREAREAAEMGIYEGRSQRDWL